jgi:predicted metalloprotease with PDZ domain
MPAYRVRAIVLITVCLLFANLNFAQSSPGPQPAPLPPPVPIPLDKPYDGTISLSVDLTNINDRILNAHETIPVKPGEMILLYPQWMPGTHSPSNPVANVAGLVISASGKRIPWLRDRVDMWAFHVVVPKGATSLELNFQYLAPVRPQQGRISNNFANLKWNAVLFYPAGYFSRRIQFAPELHLPEGWKFATGSQIAER